MPFVEGEQTSFLTKESLWSIIKHEFSLKRAWSARQDYYHREEGFVIGMDLPIGIDGASAWNHAMSTFNFYSTLDLSPADHWS